MLSLILLNLQESGSGVPPPVVPPVTPSPPTVPVQAPGTIVNRIQDASVQLTLNDVFHYWGNDVALSNTQDLLLVAGTVMGQQRVLRRLLTNPGDYLFDATYGGGLPAFVGATTDAAKITALIRSQMALEAAVSQDPSNAPQIQVGPGPTATDATALQITIRYTDAPTGAPQVLSFTLSK